MCNIVLHRHWRRTGLNSMGASISTTSGRGRKREHLYVLILGQGRNLWLQVHPLQFGAFVHRYIVFVYKHQLAIVINISYAKN